MPSHGSNTGAGAGGVSDPPAPAFPGVVPDMIRVDPDAVLTLSALGRERGLFGRTGDWPTLAEHLARLSAARLAMSGTEEWERAGGDRDADGRLTFAENSTGMQVALRELATGPGGFRYADGEGVGWAVRLVPVGGQRPGFVGFAVTLPSDAAAVPGLWLSERAEQLLWLIMGAAPLEAAGAFVLPDRMLAGTVWGGGARPKDWRGDLFKILRSLMRLHSAVIRFGGSRLVPRFRAESVALAHFADLGTDPKCCPPGCPMAGRGRHGHFELQLGHGFARTLAQFAGGGPHAVPIHLPTQVFGPCCRRGVTARQRGVIQGLLRELTRDGKSWRPAEVLGNRVPAPSGNTALVCPLLNETGRYVTFGGNGARAGLGYKIVGTTGGGWLARCGYPLIDTGEVVATVREFLVDLDDVAERIGLIAAAVEPSTGAWFSLADLRRAVATRHGIARLERVHLRVYGPIDYLDRLRRHYASECGFSAIPATTAEMAATITNPVNATELAARLRESGMKQTELAEALGISQPMVSRVLAGTKPFSAPLVAKALALLSERSGGVFDGKEV